MERIKRALINAVNATLVPLLALLLIFEEWGWEPLSRLLANLAKLPVWGRVEKLIANLPPWAALITFFVPMLTLIPVKLLAWYWVAQGHTFLGLGIIVLAKLVGTAIVARLFTLTNPALMQIPWFARLYNRWKAWKDRLIARVKDTPQWRAFIAKRRRWGRQGRCVVMRVRRAFVPA
jgi:hypothetical protein